MIFESITSMLDSNRSQSFRRKALQNLMPVVSTRGVWMLRLKHNCVRREQTLVTKNKVLLKGEAIFIFYNVGIESNRHPGACLPSQHVWQNHGAPSAVARRYLAVWLPWLCRQAFCLVKVARQLVRVEPRVRTCPSEALAYPQAGHMGTLAHVTALCLSLLAACDIPSPQSLLLPDTGLL